MTVKVRAEIVVGIEPPAEVHCARTQMQEALRKVKESNPSLIDYDPTVIANTGRLRLTLEVEATSYGDAEEIVYSILDELVNEMPDAVNGFHNSDQYLTSA